jgi:hypothetical protein
MTTPMCNSKQVKQLHGGRAGTRTPDLLRVKLPSAAMFMILYAADDHLDLF